MRHLTRVCLFIGLLMGLLFPVHNASAGIGSEPYSPIQGAENPAELSLAAELQAAAWYDGPIVYSQIVNCVSIIQGQPYYEAGIGTYAGFAADPNTAQPAPDQVYYLHVAAYGLGNACSGQRIWVEIQLPANTSLAITGTNPVVCLAGGTIQGGCPQSLPFNGTSYAIPSTDSAHANTWPLPQGGYWEFRIPVVSSTTLTNNPFKGHVRALDGNSNPWLNPEVGVYVFSGTPTILYPSPSTTITGTLTPAYKSTAFLYNYNLSGGFYFDIGTTTSYGFTDAGSITNAYPAYEVWTDWVGLPGLTIQPSTTYHWRLRFAASNGTTYLGADQIFTTPSLGKLTVGSGAAASCTGASLDTALSTGGVKEIVFNCGPSPVTVTLSGVKSISSALTIDGGNKVTLVAAPNLRHFDITNTGNLTLNNIALTGGKGAACGGSVKVVNGGKLTATRVQFINNQTSGNGGALCVEAGGSAELSYVLLKSNTASLSGGAAYNQGSLGLYWSDISNNSAQVNGGAFWNNFSLDISGSLVADNSVPTSAVARGTHEGGGIYNNGYTAINNSTITGNSAYYAAGIYSNADFWLNGTTLASNTAAGGIGGFESKGGGNSQIRNSIIANNLPDNCGTGYTKTITSNGNNLESSNQCNFGAAGDKVNTNPRLLALKWNGGFSRTMALQTGSPAIDAADNVYCGFYDQRGFAGPATSEIVSRNVDGDGNGSIICDMGAFEYHPDIDKQTQVFLPLIKR